MANAEHLSLHFFEQISFAPTEQPVYVLDISQSTHLRSLEFSGWLPQTHIVFQHPPAPTFSHIKKIELHSGFTFGLCELFQFLATVPHIEELVAFVPHSFFRTRKPPKLGTDLSLNRLRTLSLTSMVRPGINNVSNTIAFLLGLTTPALESLRFVLPENCLQAEIVGRTLLEYILRLSAGVSPEDKLDNENRWYSSCAMAFQCCAASVPEP